MGRVGRSGGRGAKGPAKASEVGEALFALDIGTRTVIGVVSRREGRSLRVIAYEVMEHRSRAMMDGQIHDIGQVAQAVAEVRSSLEYATGMRLGKVAIAAAGRSLRTVEVSVERALDGAEEIGADAVAGLEMEAVKAAHDRMGVEADEGGDAPSFYCVGYSVKNYYLNGYLIGELLGHRGKKAGVSLLATFLPYTVVDSLYTVMGRVGLEVTNLTLEPMAALNVAIPKDLRLLNLALIDVGAGTSDIAITKDGTVVAYGMVPIAGDEVTEALSRHYLVEFGEAERVKRLLGDPSAETVGMIDILGCARGVGRLEAIGVIGPVMDEMAGSIADRILELNAKPPNAVFLVGGGCQAPGFPEALAERLGIPRERIAVKGRGALADVLYDGDGLAGPESVTPLGIAYSVMTGKAQEFISVTVNGLKRRVFGRDELTMSNVMVLAGFDPSTLIPTKGSSLSYELNGARRTVRGGYGVPAQVTVNGAEAGMGTRISSGDAIRVVKAVRGADAKLTVGEALSGEGRFKVAVDGTHAELGPKAYIGESEVTGHHPIADGDKVWVDRAVSVGALAGMLDLDAGAYGAYVNGEPVPMGYIVTASDEIAFTRPAKAADGADGAGPGRPSPKGPMDGGGEAAGRDDGPGIGVTLNGRRCVLKGKGRHAFSDSLIHADIDTKRPNGALVTLINGEACEFADEVREGDALEVYWEGAGPRHGR
ncbi:MAG: rod shape-determining protein [Oscillospiraceae bacterium]|nr:rod shape-determining protein [Oscillospiraceae bacterium]